MAKERRNNNRPQIQMAAVRWLPTNELSEEIQKQLEPRVNDVRMSTKGDFTLEQRADIAIKGILDAFLNGDEFTVDIHGVITTISDTPRKVKIFPLIIYALMNTVSSSMMDVNGKPVSMVNKDFTYGNMMKRHRHPGMTNHTTKITDSLIQSLQTAAVMCPIRPIAEHPSNKGQPEYTDIFEWNMCRFFNHPRDAEDVKKNDILNEDESANTSLQDLKEQGLQGLDESYEREFDPEGDEESNPSSEDPTSSDLTTAPVATEEEKTIEDSPLEIATIEAPVEPAKKLLKWINIEEDGFLAFDMPEDRNVDMYISVFSKRCMGNCSNISSLGSLNEQISAFEGRYWTFNDSIRDKCNQLAGKLVSMINAYLRCGSHLTPEETNTIKATLMSLGDTFVEDDLMDIYQDEKNAKSDVKGWIKSEGLQVSPRITKSVNTDYCESFYCCLDIMQFVEVADRGLNGIQYLLYSHRDQQNVLGDIFRGYDKEVQEQIVQTGKHLSSEMTADLTNMFIAMGADLETSFFHREKGYTISDNTLEEIVAPKRAQKSSSKTSVASYVSSKIGKVGSLPVKIGSLKSDKSFAKIYSALGTNGRIDVGLAVQQSHHVKPEMRIPVPLDIVSCSSNMGALLAWVWNIYKKGEDDVERQRYSWVVSYTCGFVSSLELPKSAEDVAVLQDVNENNRARAKEILEALDWSAEVVIVDALAAKTPFNDNTAIWGDETISISSLATLICASKMTLRQTNHHMGVMDRDSKYQGYLAKVVTTLKPFDTAAVTSGGWIHDFVHTSSTHSVYRSLFRETPHVDDIKEVYQWPLAFNFHDDGSIEVLLNGDLDFIAARDVSMRIDSAPSGFAPVFDTFEALRLIYKNKIHIMLGSTDDQDQVADWVQRVRANPLRYGEMAPYLCKKGITTVKDCRKHEFQELTLKCKVFLDVLLRTSSLARAACFIGSPEEARAQCMEWHGLCAASRRAGAVSKEAYNDFLAEISGGMSGNVAPAYTEHSLKMAQSLGVKNNITLENMKEHNDMIAASYKRTVGKAYSADLAKSNLRALEGDDEE